MTTRWWLARSFGTVAGSVALAPLVTVRDARRADPGLVEPPRAPVGAVAEVPTPDGARLHVRTTSRRGTDAGPTFVLTHGLSCDHRLWAYQASLLSELGRVVTWDLRGHGASEGRLADIRPDRLAEDLAAVVEATAAGPVFLVGHSLGGMVSLLALRDHPLVRARTRGAVLIATPGTELSRTVLPTGTLARLEGAAVRMFLRWLAGDPVVQRILTGDWSAGYATVRGGGFGVRPSPTHVRAFLDQIARTPPAVRRATLAGMFGTDLRGTLGAVDVPALFVVGGRDRLVPPAHSAALAAEMPQARTVVFERAGHAVVFERHAAITRRIALMVEELLVGAGDLDVLVRGRRHG